ncbi:hypothetical protein AD998_14115 [bacterium 336/3]|nr:hypothetical protein AD998_14115 [bacterium 336/3]
MFGFREKSLIFEIKQQKLLTLNYNLTIEQIFNLLPMGVGLFYAIRLLTFQKASSQGKNYIALLLFLFMGIVSFSLIAQNIKGKYVYYSLALLLGVTLSLAPTIKLAVYNYVGKKIDKPLRLFYLAFVVAGLDVVLLSIMPFLPKKQVAFNVVYYALWVVNMGGVTVVFIGQNIYFLYKLFKIINIHEKKLGSFYSFEEGVSLKWLKNLIYGYLAFIIGIIIVSLPGFDKIFMYSFELVLLAFIVYIGMKAVHYQVVSSTITDFHKIKKEEQNLNLPTIQEKPVEVFEQIIENEQDNVLEDEEIEIEEFDIQEDKFNELKSTLIQIMEMDKPYLNSRLTIYDLAEQASTNYKYLSKLINQEFNMNFASFINTYRIEEAKQKLIDTSIKNYKIEAIADLVGFHSKSAFNIAFKKITGFTPTEYKNKHLPLEQGQSA